MPPRIRRAAFVLALLLLPSFQTGAHEVPRQLRVEAFIRPDGNTLHLLIRVPLSGLLGTGMPTEGLGYLALREIGPALERTARQIAGDVQIYEDGGELPAPRIAATRISLPYDRSFATYDQAAAHLRSPPLPVDTQVYWTQGNFDAWLDYPIASERAAFAFESQLFSLAPEVTTALTVVTADQEIRAFEFLGNPGRIWLDPRWYQVVPVFGEAGFLDAFGRVDLWLFALCVLIPWRRPRAVLPIVAAFGAAYVATAIVMTYGPDASGAWLSPLAAAVAAALLLYLAIENIAASGRMRRWPGALALGVVLGVVFFLAMRPTAQFAVEHLLLSVLAFNAGIAAALAAALTAVALALALLYRFFTTQLRTVILSAIVAHYAWNALLQRTQALYGLPWPLPTPQNLVNATSWLLVVVAAAGCFWLLAGLRSQQGRTPPPPVVGTAGAEHG